MTRTLQPTVGPDGRVAIPGTQPGQTIPLQIFDILETPDENNDVGATSEEDWTAITARIKRRARRMREELPEPWRSGDHGDLLYGDDGLPR